MQAKAGGNPGVFVFADSTTTDFTANATDSAHFGVANGLRVVGPSITLDTNPGVPTVQGHVLTSDAAGVGTWQAIPGLLFTGLDATGSTRRLTAGTATGDYSTLSGGVGQCGSLRNL